LGYTFKNKALL
jgi:dsRNA-specific ribonuclease